MGCRSKLLSPGLDGKREGQAERASDDNAPDHSRRPYNIDFLRQGNSADHEKRSHRNLKYRDLPPRVRLRRMSYENNMKAKNEGRGQREQVPATHAGEIQPRARRSGNRKQV